MTSRERMLSIAVGGLIFAVATQWVLTRIRGAFADRRNDIANLQEESRVQNEQLLAGATADRWFGEYASRSLPSDPAMAVAEYQRWLLSLAGEVDLTDAVIEPAGVAAVGDVYDRYSFRIAGQTDLGGVATLLAKIANRDALHRIRQWSVSPVRGGGLKTLILVDAIALRAAPPDRPLPGVGSYRLTTSVEEVIDDIQNRNFFEPPNRPPIYVGDQTLVVTRGREATLDVRFEDPEGQPVEVSVEELPAGLRWADGKLTVEAELETEPPVVLLTGRDSGFPPRESEAVGGRSWADTPPPPPAEDEKPGFDEASQTVLTALVETGGVPAAWLQIRTRGETLKLRVGDDFEIGSVRGTIAAIDSRSVTLTVEDRQVTMRPSDKLREAVRE